ncbi:MAG: hypothetical protein WCP74_10745 [Sphingobacteriia bacterium]
MKSILIILFFTIISFALLSQNANRNTLIANSIKLPFSSQKALDSFSIKLVGSTLLKATVYFQIFDHQQKIIYRDSFPSIYLLDYSIEDNDPLTKKESYIKKRMKDFFSKENFQQPAIGKKDPFDDEYTGILRSTWDEIQADPKRVGFYYLVGEENGKHITFSKKLKKVVIYRACC